MTYGEMAAQAGADKKKGKRLWWLKLPKDFFTSNNVIKKMRKLPGGDTYVVITLKLLLLSLDNDFRIYYEGVEDTFPKDIALTLDESPEAVEVTLRMLLQQGWLVQEDPETIFAPKSQEIAGSESASAKWVRDYRKRIKNEESTLLPLHCNENVMLEKRREEKRRTEIEEMQEEKEREQPLSELIPEAFDPSKEKASPSLDDVMRLASGIPNLLISPEGFYERFASSDWTDGGKDITDWMALFTGMESLQRRGVRI